MEVIEEHGTTIKTYPGKLKKSDLVFYNKNMLLNRNISTISIYEFQKQTKRKLVYGDVFAATGIRGIRVLNEIKGIKQVIFNDLNKNAVELIKENLIMNRIEPDKFKIYNDDAASLLHKYRFLIDVVDIDPFGSPAYYLDSLSRAVTNKGMVMITATDTAPLCGTYPKTCLRRYHSIPLRIDIKHDIGLRILIKELSYSLSRYDKAFIPLISYSHLHYFRIIGKIKKSKSMATQTIKDNIGYLNYCKDCGYRNYNKDIVDNCPVCNNKMEHAGKLWIKNTSDITFLNSVLKNPLTKKYNHKTMEKILKLLKEENSFEGNYYNIHNLSKHTKNKPLKLKELISYIKKKGYNISRSHYNPLIIKTDIPYNHLLDIYNTPTNRNL